MSLEREKNNQEKSKFSSERGTSLRRGICMVWSPFPVLSLIYRETNTSCWEILDMVDGCFFFFFGRSSFLSKKQFRWNFNIYRNVSLSAKLSDRTLVWKESKYFTLRNWNILIVMFLFSFYTGRKIVREEIYISTWQKRRTGLSKYGFFCIWEKIRKLWEKLKKEGTRL